MNNYVLVTLDSCRYDSFVRAEPRNLRRLGPVQQRYSYASWTAPSHYNLLMGLMPHCNPRNTLASEYYKRDFLQFNTRLGVADIEFKSIVPKLYLPLFLKERLGYSTHAFVSLPVLNPQTILNRGFDSYELMPKHNDLRSIVRQMKFAADRPSFFLINAGETHYPYASAGESTDCWPKIHGVHGVFKHLGDSNVPGMENPGADNGEIPTAKVMKDMHNRQIEAVRNVDVVIGELLDSVPEHTYITVTADHGELFGEDGYFGHGPVVHPKVLEVPFVEGQVR